MTEEEELQAKVSRLKTENAELVKDLRYLASEVTNLTNERDRLLRESKQQEDNLMASLASKPDWAPSVWRSRAGRLFAQFGQDVLAFDAKSEGLAKLLKLIPFVEDQPGYVTGRQNVVDHILRKPIKLAKKTERLRKMQKLAPKRKSILADLIKRANVKEDK